MRPWFISKALKSSRSLSDGIGEMTEEELLHVLQIEFDSSRRSVMIDMMIQKAANLNRKKYLLSLQEKYRGTSKKRSTDPR